MNVIAIARRGIGVSGPLPVGLAIARGIAIELVRHAEPSAVALQVAASEAELAWIRMLSVPLRSAAKPPGIAFALRVANGTAVVGSLVVADREAALGHRVGAVVRIGAEAIELDRRDGTPPIEVEPALLGLDAAMASARGSPAAA